MATEAKMRGSRRRKRQGSVRDEVSAPELLPGLPSRVLERINDAKDTPKSKPVRGFRKPS